MGKISLAELRFKKFKNENLDMNKKKLIEFLDEVEVKIEQIDPKFDINIELIFRMNGKTKNNYFNIDCTYIFKPPNSGNSTFIERNILEYKTNSQTLGFQYMISDINELNSEYSDDENSSESEDEKYHPNEDETLYKITEHIKKMFKHEKWANFIQQLENRDFFVSSGNGRRIIVYWYDNNYMMIIEISPAYCYEFFWI
jgi:hypothetical protein